MQKRIEEEKGFCRVKVGLFDMKLVLGRTSQNEIYFAALSNPLDSHQHPFPLRLTMRILSA